MESLLRRNDVKNWFYTSKILFSNIKFSHQDLLRPLHWLLRLFIIFMFIKKILFINFQINFSFEDVSLNNLIDLTKTFVRNKVQFILLVGLQQIQQYQTNCQRLYKDKYFFVISRERARYRLIGFIYMIFLQVFSTINLWPYQFMAIPDFKAVGF